MLESPLPLDSDLSTLDRVCQLLYPICEIVPSDPRNNLLQLLTKVIRGTQNMPCSATVKVDDILEKILAYLDFITRIHPNDASSGLLHFAIKEIPKHLQALIEDATTQPQLHAILHPPVPARKLNPSPPPVTISENRPPAGLHALNGTGGLNFNYLPRNSGGESDVLAWIVKESQKTDVPPYWIYSVELPHSHGTESLQPAQDFEKHLPSKILNLQEGDYPTIKDAVRIREVPCQKSGILPIPPGYTLVGANCYDAAGQIIPNVEVQFTPGPVACRVQDDRLACISYELVPDDASTHTLEAFLRQAFSEFKIKLDDFLHPYLVTVIKLFKEDPDLKPKPWDTPLDIAKRFLQKAFLDANIHKCPLYGASKSDNLQLHAAYTQGVLDIYALYAPIMSCSFYADFYARLFNALGIPSFTVGCFVTNFPEQDQHYLRKQPHGIVASLYNGGVYFSDPTPSMDSSAYKNPRGDTIPPYSMQARNVEEYIRVFKTQFSEHMQGMASSIFSYLLKEPGTNLLKAIERPFLSQRLHLLDSQSKIVILHKIIWNAWIEQMVALQKWDVSQCSTVNENIAKLTQRLENFYGVSLKNPVKPITELTTEEKQEVVSVFKQQLCSRCFLKEIPYPHAGYPSLDNLALKAVHLYDRVNRFIETFQISEQEWNETEPAHDGMETIEIGNETFRLGLRNSALLKHFLPLMFVVETLDPTLLKQIQEKFLPEVLILIDARPAFKAMLERVGRWINEHGNPVTLRAAVYSFYLYYLFPPGTPERAKLALFFETIENFVFSFIPSKANSYSTKTYPTREDFYQKILSLLRGAAFQSELGIQFLKSILCDGNHSFYKDLVNDAGLTYLNQMHSMLAEKSRVALYSSPSYFIGKGTLSIDTIHRLDDEPAYLEDIQTTAKKILSTTSGTFLNPQVKLPPKVLLKKFETQNLTRKSTSDIDYSVTPIPGKRPILREDSNTQYFRSLSESVRDIMGRLKRGENIEQTRLTTICADIISIGSLQDVPETHLVKRVQTEPTVENLEAFAQYLDSFLTPPSYLKPIYSESPSPPKNGEQIYVELYDVLDKPEKVRALFDFLDLKQKTNTHRQPLEITLYFCGMESEFFDLRNHPLELETIALFKCKNKPNKESFVKTFWMRYVQASQKKSTTPPSEAISSEVRFPLIRLQPKPQTGITIFADPIHWEKTIQMLQNQKHKSPVNIILLKNTSQQFSF